MASQLLEIDGLAVSSNGVPLLDGVSLSLEKGELVALLGPSGCGKTTLLRTICGLIDPRAGSVRLDGKEAEEIGWPAFRRSIPLVSQRPVLLDVSVEANLRQPFRYLGKGYDYPESRARDLLDRVQVGSERASQEARSLSVGQQQRVCFVRALLLDPLALLLDEPTSALDEESRAIIEDLIRESSAESQIGALIVTHDAQQAERLCHRAVDLRPFVRTQKPGDGNGAKS